MDSDTVSSVTSSDRSTQVRALANAEHDDMACETSKGHSPVITEALKAPRFFSVQIMFSCLCCVYVV